MKEVNFREAFGEQKPVGFDEVAITVSSPDAMRSWSKGEVKNPETINYRTFKPEKGGLFCERIFGPTRDWECSCGKYKRIKHKGVICDRCGVEVTLSRVRRERMGHIDLAVPVSHIWFYKCMPSRIGLMLDMTSRQLERVIYYEDYIVTDPGSTPLQRCQLLTEAEYREAEDQYGDSFTAGMGAEAIRKLLEQTDLAKLNDEIEVSMVSTRSKQLRKKLAKRLKLVQGFATSRTRPEWMILNVLPVIPPDLRPLVPLEGGRFATSDLNELYRRVINRNNRLRTLLQHETPEVIIRNEKRMLQESVDALFDNGRHGRAVTGAANRPLKSLSDMLKGKGGRFRQNLLGKRVDYSGRSVIVIGPELKLNQCGLPKKMALVLFEPFIIRRLKEQGHVHTVRSAKKLIERQTPEVWDILEEVTKGHPVLLNRAPTLHRLSIQAFEPLLIEGEAIRIHPLVCTAYNADFDGDQMAVHVPLSVEAQMEARMLMLATNNIFSPSSGKPITNPSQDIPLGCYYLTQKPRGEDANKEKRMPLFANAVEVELALSEGSVRTHTRIRFKNPDFDRTTIYGDPTKKILETTAGRVVFNQIWPADLGFYNKVCGKKQLSDVIWRCYKIAGQQKTVETLDLLKELGFREATKAGISIGITDMIIPPEKIQLLEKAYREVAEVQKQYLRGIITDGERKNKVQDIWTHTGEEVANALFRTLDHNDGRREMNPVFMMVDSGARGNRTQIKQLAGMRGLMAKPSGEIIEQPITANFREGLSVLEYFISTHGARKGLADTALKTANSGYLTRRLVDVAHDAVVTEYDCGTLDGIRVAKLEDAGETIQPLADRILGRVTLDDIVDPVTDDVIVPANTELDEAEVKKIEEAGIEEVAIRSVLTCQTKRGICAMCYGRDLARGYRVNIGEAVGVIAAQSIGEPGTQLTMRTFHIGGAAARGKIEQSSLEARTEGKMVIRSANLADRGNGRSVVMNRHAELVVVDDTGREREHHRLVYGAVLFKPDGSHVKAGEQLAEWDPHALPTLTEVGGRIKFQDLVESVTVQEKVDEVTGLSRKVIIESRAADLKPAIVILDPNTNAVKKLHAGRDAVYLLPVGINVQVQEGDVVNAGDIIGKTPRVASKTQDITGGLPRVAELFEARKPKDHAVITEIDGEVSFGKDTKGKRKVLVTPIHEDGSLDQDAAREYLIPKGKHIQVQNGDHVRAGEALMDGAANPHDILRVKGEKELAAFLVNEIQQVYRLQGVTINDKHIEVIVRQMLRRVRIKDPGDTTFLVDEQVEKYVFERENEKVFARGQVAATGEPLLLGITKASLSTESFISASSFQETTKVLTEAAIQGKTDDLRGLKENVIMGRLIPAGTGLPAYKRLRMMVEGEGDAPAEVPQDRLEYQVANEE